jgi:hypothetical protein
LPRFSTAAVAEVLAERPGLQRVRLDNGRRAYVLTQLTGPVAVGERVVVNTTAVDLGLGTGGWDVVHWNLARREWHEPGPGHVLKLRYTGLQVDTGVAEETAPRVPDDLGGRPVVACALHSQVACVAVAFKHLAPERRLAYVMTDSAALPLALSDLVADLRRAGLLDLTVTAGQAFGGEVEAVNVPSALLLAAARADAVVVGPGPGVVGTGTRYGFSGLEVATVVDTVDALGGVPIVAVRYSDADSRERHRGISHHSLTVLDLARAEAAVPVPRGRTAPQLARADEIDVPDVPALLAAAGLRVTTMGRSPEEDPGFFAYAGAAGAAAAASIASSQ